MIKIINKIQTILLIILFFSLPLINSHFFDLFWIKWWFYVSWNYEFTKVIFFNIFSWILLFLFLVQYIFTKKNHKNFNQLIFIPKIIYLLVWIIIISTIFSDFFYTSLLWNNSKSHSSIMFLNIIWLFIILINSHKKLLNTLIKTTIISSLFVVLIWIKEYFLPTFNYWDLWNRALSTFWHPNYLALFILIIIPLIPHPLTHSLTGGRKVFSYNIFLFILLIILLFLTKSAWWILIFIFYIFYKLINNNRFRFNIKNEIIYLFLWIFIFSLIFYQFWLITKLHSFLSRFFIWETTLRIIFSDIKNVLIWSWLWTLEYIFDWFKSPFLYIFENFWFTADRPHNLAINFFYHFWIIWLYFIFLVIYKIFKNYKNIKYKYKKYYESLFLFFIFTIFNFPSIAHYTIIILIWTYIYQKSYINTKLNYYKIFLINSILITSIFWIYFNTIYYIEEHKIYQNSSYISSNILYNKIKSENYKKNIFWEWFTNIENMCENLILYSNSIENNFYCWNILWKIDKKLAIIYYNQWLSKTPDLWNQDSKYLDNYIIKNFVDKKRFFSEKYSNINQILERIWLK